ncbi:MAG TPA: serine--tRNA ligase [Candidatus Bipolaricaulota bacterium]|nr:serine--tRNA ligase [Candidatus Bipolaricaulota bacterium]
MLDIKFIRENPKLIQKTAQLKGIDLDLKRLLKLDEKRRELQQEIEKIKAEKKEFSKKMSGISEAEKKKVLKSLKKQSKKEKKLELKHKEIYEEFEHLMLFVPAVMDPRIPEGKDDSENVEIESWGEIPQFAFNIKDHLELGEKLGIIDSVRGVKIAGSRSYFLVGDGARLEQALLQFAMSKLINKGYTLMSAPVLLNQAALVGTGYFPGAEEQTYFMEKDDKYLAGTSEVAVTSYHADEILNEETLPKKFIGVSSCFRREAGTYGKDTRGLYRVHQFNKVEQVIVCKNDSKESERMHEELMQNAKEILQELRLPYRVVVLCTGDMGMCKVYANDIETWMPSRKGYGETHSCTTFHDFQSRRLNMRYRDMDGKVHYCHTLNNTAIATPRILIPLLEIYQNQDGSVEIPEVLRPYMDGQKRIERKV